ncbi:MAG: hypothetical protein IPK66_14680 [Rhodospirillales bacterium]|nr:hypothetical protein [Rhodospirillales bacterium]
MDIESTIKLAAFSYGMMAVIAGLSAVFIRGIVIVLAASKSKKKAVAAPTAVSISVAPVVDETAAHVAAVAAAVYAILGAHRLVHIGEVPRGAAWTASGRTMHQTSHVPQRTPR